MTEDELLRTLDGGDPEVLLVCADWHEGNGNAPLAELLRLEHRLRTKPRPRNLLELGATVSVHSYPEIWLDKLVPSSPIGSWDGIDSDREGWKFDFHADHKLSYTRGGSRHDDGEWRQVGSLALMTTNNKFTTYVGLVLADRIIGAAKTIHDLAWTWEVMRVDTPKPSPKLRARSPDRARRAELQRASRAGTEDRKPTRRKAATNKPAANKPAAKPAAPKKFAKPANKAAANKPAASKKSTKPANKATKPTKKR